MRRFATNLNYQMILITLFLSISLFISTPGFLHQPVRKGIIPFDGGIVKIRGSIKRWWKKAGRAKEFKKKLRIRKESS